MKMQLEEKTQEQADAEAVKEWMERNPLTLIDNKGNWTRNGIVVKQAMMPETVRWSSKW